MNKIIFNANNLVVDALTEIKNKNYIEANLMGFFQNKRYQQNHYS